MTARGTYERWWHVYPGDLDEPAAGNGAIREAEPEPEPATPGAARPRVLVIDNYDSFVHNLARYLRRLGAETCVVRNDEIGLGEIERERPSHIVLSPGPCTPAEAGVSNTVIAAFGETIPILGVCLGHQCIGAVYGGLVTRAPHPMHGKTSLVYHQGRSVFRRLPSPFSAARYHSLVVHPASVPSDLEVLATTVDGDVMAVAHRRNPVVGVQFHPESVLTEHGYRLLANFLTMRASTAVDAAVP